MKAFATYFCSLTMIANVLCCSGSLDAQLIAYDGFDYPAEKEVRWQNGGSGFRGPWRPGGFNATYSQNYLIKKGSLKSAGIATTGNRLSSTPTNRIAGIARNFNEPLGEPETSCYISFLLQPERILDRGIFNGFFGVVLENSIEPELFVGKGGAGNLSRYVCEFRGGALQFSSDVAPRVGRTALIVVKCEFTDEFDSFTMYVNPAIDRELPLDKGDTIVARYEKIPGLTVYSSGEFSLDEIRVGKTLADVLPPVSDEVVPLVAEKPVVAPKTLSSKISKGALIPVPKSANDAEKKKPSER